jgi:adenosylcobinamide kinase/adenosylcobinamide-phosphate guanylyltransferase
MQQAGDSSVVLVLGGVRSGKSRYAQRIAEASRRVTFIATASRVDDEMTRKVERHRSDRPADWRTIEEKIELARVLQSIQEDSDAVLIDCLTLFTSNLISAWAENGPELHAKVEELCDALRTARCRVILVSNEVGSGVVPAYASGRRFRDLAGEINQRVAAVADVVVLTVAGLPLVLKGSSEGLPR